MTEPVYNANKSLGAKIRRKMTRLFDHKMAYFPKTLGPRLTLSFDDVAASTTTATADLLDELGIKATYYVSAGLMEKSGDHLGGYASRDQIIKISQKGHEIGCHTFSHLDCAKESKEVIISDIERNKQFFTDNGLNIPKNFAYPYGEVSHYTKKLIDTRFSSARALHAGIIERHCDLNQLPSIGIEGKPCSRKFDDLFFNAVEQNGWLILYTHDVRENPSKYGTDLKTLKNILLKAKDMGFRFLTVDGGISEALSQQSAKLSPHPYLKADLV